MWTASNLYKVNEEPSEEQEAEFLKHVLLDDGVVPWREYDHPTYGRIEIGGLRKEWGRTPPSFLLEEELHRNMAFALYHASLMPLLRIADVAVEPLGNRLFKIWVTIENSRPIPTRTGSGRGPPHQPAGPRHDPGRRCQGRLERPRHGPILQASGCRRVSPGAGGAGHDRRHGRHARAVHRPGQRLVHRRPSIPPRAACSRKKAPCRRSYRKIVLWHVIASDSEAISHPRD